MAERADQREAIADALKSFDSNSLDESARNLFGILGYKSERRLAIITASQFIKQLDPTGRLTEQQRESLSELKSLQLLFQLTGNELDSRRDLFDDGRTVQTSKMESYLFFAAELPKDQYTRTALSGLVRAINKPLPMPALVLFRHGDSVSIGIIHRRLHKRDESRDVLEKVTLIKDVSLENPIRAHLEILNDFVLENLDAEYGVPNFVRLHEAWQKRLDAYKLSDAFYREIADWYFWAHHLVEDGTLKLPVHCDTEQEKSLFLIRLLTRVIFCWFLVEKRLIPSELFREKRLKSLLKDFNPSDDAKRPDKSSSFYHAVLQNLFFGTLNMPREQRAFREKTSSTERYDKNYGITNLWRYEDDFKNPSDWLTLAAKVPFLNGGLFDCLDEKTGNKTDNYILDGFSDNAKLRCELPNDLFFGQERVVDLSADYGEEDKRTARSKKAKVRGLIATLSRYKFTVEENTPLEEEIALDPELLGKVFENLLASYNEDTRTTARKALGAFYTPREIVSYMVDEALKSYLSTQVPRCKQLLDLLFSNKPEGLREKLEEVAPGTKDALVDAIGRVKILDPACGSGAFPMGALHRLVDLLQKLDPNNESWKRDRLAIARQNLEWLKRENTTPEQLRDSEERIAGIEKSFDTRFHALDFARKLYLIENCIYGVDIQPIATQIAKLRFFISLVVDQKVSASADNLGVRPLPNLETRIVAADTLIPIEKPKSDLFSKDLDKLRNELAAIRHEHFNAGSPKEKRKWREADEAKRNQIAQLLGDNHALPVKEARMLAEWDPYDQNSSAPFFDFEWMFGSPVNRVQQPGESRNRSLDNSARKSDSRARLEGSPTNPPVGDDGFDVIISNPPYRKERDSKKLFERVAATPWGSQYQESKMDFWFYFMHRTIDLARRNGTIVFITSRYWIESSGASKLISRMSRDVTPLSVVDIGKLQVFDNVAGHHMIHVYRRGQGTSTILVKRLHDDLSGLNSAKSGENVEVSNRTTADFFSSSGRIKLYSSRLPIPSDQSLGELFQVSQGVVQNPDKVNRKNAEKFSLREGAGVFVLTLEELATLRLSKAELMFVKPFYDEADIRRFHAVESRSRLLYLTRKNCPSIEVYPGLKRHLARFRPIMEERRETRSGTNEWFHLHWPREESLFERPHLVLPSMFIEPRAAVFASSAYVGIGSNVVVANDPKADLWILACLLNSELSAFWWRENGKQRGAGVDVGVDRLRGFPLPRGTISSSGISTIHSLASMIVRCAMTAEPGAQGKATRDSLMVAFLERLLNGLVYELYFLGELRAAGLSLLDLVCEAKLPILSALSDAEQLPRIRQAFNEIYDPSHPLRIALDKLQTLDFVRIIEGKA